jgi:hypothetical protein
MSKERCSALGGSFQTSQILSSARESYACRRRKHGTNGLASQKSISVLRREVEDLVGSLVELIQPILMLIIGGVVGVLFASKLTPIFNFVSTSLN